MNTHAARAQAAWNRLRLHGDIGGWRHGRLAPMAVALLAAALLAQWLLPALVRSGTPPRLPTVSDDAPASAAPDPARAERLAQGTALHTWVAKLAATAQAQGLGWTQADYRREQDAGSPIVRWRITQNQRVDEIALRRAIAAVLQRHRHVSLDRLRIERGRDEHAPGVTARLEWSLWMLDEALEPATAPTDRARAATDRALFARPVSVAPSASATAASEAPPPAAAPAAPPLPYRFIGRLSRDEGDLWFLEREGQSVIARAGDALHEHHRLDTADATRLWFVHLPTGTRQPLPITTER